MTRHLATRSLLNSLGVVLYVIGVAAIMSNGGRWFGEKDTILTSIFVLLLACISAATVGGLVFGYPLWLFLNGKKREGLHSAMLTVGFLSGEAVLVLVTMIVKK